MDKDNAMCELNADLSRLIDFGKKWKVQFEPTKTHAMLVSNTKDSGIFPLMSQLRFGDAHIQFEEELLLVGFLFDKKLTWRPMVSRICSKARQALGVSPQRSAWLFGSGCPFQSFCQINPRIWELGISSSCPRVSTKI